MRLAGHTVLYGGSFDPPHLGHQFACLCLLEGLGANAVWLIPTFEHVFGKNLSPFDHRLAMCKLLAAPFGARARVLSIERDRGGPSRTYDTLVALDKQYPQERWALAVGADIVPETPDWFRWDDLKARVPIVVLGRVGHSGPADTVALPDISSTNLRARLGRGESGEGLMPTSVVNYVREHKLYQDTP